MYAYADNGAPAQSYVYVASTYSSTMPTTSPAGGTYVSALLWTYATYTPAGGAAEEDPPSIIIVE